VNASVILSEIRGVVTRKEKRKMLEKGEDMEWLFWRGYQNWYWAGLKVFK
jgi:hypothetical protein